MFSNEMFGWLFIFIFRFPNSFSDILNAISSSERTLSFWEKNLHRFSIQKSKLKKEKFVFSD